MVSIQQVQQYAVVQFVLLLCCFGEAYSAEYKHRDSVKTLPEVVVIETHNEILKKVQSVQTVSTVTQEEATKLGVHSVAEVLQTMPGVFIRNFGGLGGLKTVSLRGSNSAQTLVLFEGIPLNSSQNGIVDLSLLPAQSFSSVEVTQGGSAGVGGAYAIGGTIALGTPRWQDSSGLLTSASVASFGERKVAARASIASASGVVTCVADAVHSNGNYPFTFNQFGEEQTLQRSNSQFTGYSALLSYQTNPKDSSHFSTHAMLRSSLRGAPGAVLQGFVENTTAQLSDNDILFVARYQHHGTSIQTDIKSYARFGEQIYTDDYYLGIPNFSVRNTYISRDGGAIAECRVGNATRFVGVHALAEYNDIRGNLLRANTGSMATRFHAAAALFSQYTIFAEVDSTTWGLEVQARVRGDRYSDVATAISPRAGVRVFTNAIPLQLRCAYSFNFRPPSFNELYFQNYGNTNLRSEKSHSVELGVLYNPHPYVLAELSAFSLSTYDQIMAVPKTALSWTASNIAKVQTTGIDVSTLLRFVKPIASVRVGYTYQHVVDATPNSYTYGKQILYTPLQCIHATLHGETHDISYGATYQWISTRYSQSDNAANSALPSYGTLQLYVGYSLQNSLLPLRLQLHCDNLFNTSYQVISNFPMPGRLFRAVLSFEL